MRSRSVVHRRLLASLMGLTLGAMVTPSAWAGDWMSCWPFKKKCDPAPSCSSTEPAPAPALAPVPAPGQPPAAVPPPAVQAPAVDPSTLAAAPETGPAVGGEGFSLASSNVGYIDSAIPQTGVRLRVDSAYNSNRPDRAEYFYPKYQSIGGRGEPGPETNVDYQDIRTMFEWAPAKNFSLFVEAPYRILEPDVNPAAHGWSDLNFGFKYAFVAEETKYWTFQLTNYAPTGAAARGLGTGHYSIEPALLYYNQVATRLTVEAMLKDWIPINGTDYAGNVLEYGVGVSLFAAQWKCVKIKPVVELVGWTVLSGQESDIVGGFGTGTVQVGPGAVPPGTVLTAGAPTQVGTFNNSAKGDTIINAKVGMRFDVGDRWSLYGGYGRALTGAVWYKDLYRLELRWNY